MSRRAAPQARSPAARSAEGNPVSPSEARDPRFALGQSIGLAAFVGGYPLVEMVRTCRLQTGDDKTQNVAWHGGIDQIQHVLRARTRG